MLRTILFGTVSVFCLMSCGELPKASHVSETKKAWSRTHSPYIMDSGTLQAYRYKNRFDELPKQGFLSKQPWTGDFWPTDHGGITYRWFDLNTSERQRYSYTFLSQEVLRHTDLKKLSPSEKFDIYLGRFDYPFTRKERTRTQILVPGASAADWEGLCHAWAAAALFFEEPGPVTMKSKTGMDVPFGSADVKALLVYFLHEADAQTRFLGTRCDVNINELNRRYNSKLISRSYYLQKLEECSGLNAGSFHVVLANQIGRLKEGFVIDGDNSEEIWNYPVFGFQSQVISDKKTKSPEAAPETVREVEIRTQAHIVIEEGNSWNLSGTAGVTVVDYHYRVELNARGEIIGGTWISEERPGFAWMQNLPPFRGQYFEQIRDIYEASLRAKRGTVVSTEHSRRHR